MHELLERLLGSMRQGLWVHGRRSKERLASEPGESLRGGGKDSGKPEREEVRGISWRRESIPRDLKLFASNLDEDLILEQLLR